MRKRNKNKKKYNKYHKEWQRVPNEFTKIRDLLPLTILRDDERKIRKRSVLSDIEDNRRYRPFLFSGPMLSDGRRAEISYNDKVQQGYNRDRLTPMFTEPEKTIVCIRRKERREALFRKNKIGKGKKVTPFRKFNENSKIICKKK